MPKKDPGYVYILTNPSFKEDWVKIGKSGRPVNVRSKELDNTAVPLPFEIYATLKTVKYNEAEKLVHEFIDQLTTKRIRKTREFFNLRPEEALKIFRSVSHVLDDAEISIYQDNVIVDTIAAPKKEEPKTQSEVEEMTAAPPTGKCWLIPFNKKFFDLDGCIKKYGHVYWSQKCSFAIGDTVYLYSSKPDARIAYRFEVKTINIPEREATEGKEFRKTETSMSFKETDLASLLVPTGTTKNKALSLDHLKEHGLKSAPFGPVMISQEKYSSLQAYITENFDEKTESAPAKRPRFRFSMCNIKPGETVLFTPLNMTVTVSSDNTVAHNGTELKLSAFAKRFMPDNMRTPTNSYQGSKYFTYNGEVLDDIRTRMEASKNVTPREL